jgi:hypothetical protein
VEREEPEEQGVLEAGLLADPVEQEELAEP